MESKYYVYYLRRPDKEDPLELGKWQPFYVGKGSNGRIYDHRRGAKHSYKKSGSKSIKEHIIHKLWGRGLDFIEETIVMNLTNEEANFLEKEFIRLYGRINIGTGCLANLTDGGDGVCGWIPSEETRKLWSEQRSGENAWHWGLHLSEETKRKIGDAHLGKIVSEDTRKKQSDAKIGKTVSDETKQKLSESHSGENNYWWGKKLSEEHIRHLSESHMGQVPWNKGLTKENSEGMKRISEFNKGKTPFLGKKHTPETKLKMSKYATGRVLSPECIAKRSKTRKLNNKLRRWDKIIMELVNSIVTTGGYIND